ncbi:hypothetical protein QCA50_019432 [Cerrena zonata]|uniref:G domain-containing protein n=1 Tax=Cerrena zonata TaxID=2478898 RepID=A0AAW0FAZ0_9APHY
MTLSVSTERPKVSLIALGANFSGKTSLVSKFCSRRLSSGYNPTIHGLSAQRRKDPAYFDFADVYHHTYHYLGSAGDPASTDVSIYDTPGFDDYLIVENVYKRVKGVKGIDVPDLREVNGFVVVFRCVRSARDPMVYSVHRHNTDIATQYQFRAEKHLGGC